MLREFTLDSYINKKGMVDFFSSCFPFEEEAINIKLRGRSMLNIILDGFNFKQNLDGFLALLVTLISVKSIR